MNPARTRIFYIFLAIIWFAASIYLFVKNPTGNIVFPVFYLGVGVGIVILSIYYERIIFGLYIDIGPDIIEFRLNRGKSEKIEWTDITAINLHQRDITFIKRDGTQQFINLHSFKEDDWKAFTGLIETRARENQVPFGSKTSR